MSSNETQRLVGTSARRWLAVIGILAVTAAAVLLVMTRAGAQGGRTIELTARLTQVEFIDSGAGGPGNLLVGMADLFDDPALENPVGFVRFTCVNNVEGVMCTNHNTLFNRGQIISQQSGDPAEGPFVTEAITGGTGEFRNSRGEVEVDFTQQGEGIVRLKFRVIG